MQLILNKHKIEEILAKIKQTNDELAALRVEKNVDQKLIDQKLSDIDRLTKEIRQLIRLNLELEYDIEIAKSKREDFTKKVQAKKKIENWEKLKTAFPVKHLILGTKHDTVKQLRQLLSEFKLLSFLPQACIRGGDVRAVCFHEY